MKRASVYLNGLIYLICWQAMILQGPKYSGWFALIVFSLGYLIQIGLFFWSDRKSLLLALPLSIYGLVLGFLQEVFLLYGTVLQYPDRGMTPPLWLILLYPLFSLTLNSSLSFLNRSLTLTFILGALGGFASYFAGEKLDAVTLYAPYFPLFLSWGIYLLLMILLNRRLGKIYEKMTDRKRLEEPITVIFDGSCRVCSKEMQGLQKRKQTGKIIYTAPKNEEELSKITTKFSYAQAMKKIHAIEANEKVIQGVDALAEVYARTGMPLISILLKAPLFTSLFRLLYIIWAKTRRIWTLS